MSKNKQTQIKTSLKEAGVKQKQIAVEINVTPQAVNQVVLGLRTTPRIRTAIAQSLNKQVSDLWPEQEQT